MAELAETSAHFVRCIAPNPDAAAGQLHARHVLRQLRCSGTSALLRMSHAAHPTRIPYNELYSRYRSVAPAELSALPPNDFVEALVLALGVTAHHTPARRDGLLHTPPLRVTSCSHVGRCHLLPLSSGTR